MPDILVTVLERIGVISTAPNGWEKQLNLVQWGDKEPRYDIRRWSPGAERFSKGVGFTREELKSLMLLLQDFFADSVTEDEIDEAANKADEEE